MTVHSLDCCLSESEGDVKLEFHRENRTHRDASEFPGGIPALWLAPMKPCLKGTSKIIELVLFTTELGHYPGQGSTELCK